MDKTPWTFQRKALIALSWIATIPLAGAKLDLKFMQMELIGYYGITIRKYTLLLTLYYFLSFFTLFFVSYLSDKIGRRIMLMITFVINTLGSVLNLISAYKKSFTILIISRTVMGLVGETIQPILDDVMADYAGDYLATVFASRNNFIEVGVILTSIGCSNLFILRGSMVEPWWFMLALLFLGLLSSIGIIMLDNKDNERSGSARPTFKEICNIGPDQVWVSLGASVTFGAFIAQNSFMVAYIEAQGKFGVQMANLLNSVYMFASIIFGFFAGKLIDSSRYLLAYTLVSAFLFAGRFAIFMSLKFCDHCYWIIIPSVFQGLLCPVLFGSVFKSIILMAPSNLRAFSFGIYKQFATIFVAIFIVVTGFLQSEIKNSYKAFLYILLFMMCMSLIAIIMIIIGLVINGKRGRELFPESQSIAE